MRTDRKVGKELAREVRALAPALRYIFLTCGDPTPENLVRLVAEVPAAERGGLAARASGVLYDHVERQADLQWQRFRRREREAAYFITYATIEDFPMPRARE